MPTTGAIGGRHRHVNGQGREELVAIVSDRLGDDLEQLKSVTGVVRVAQVRRSDHELAAANARGDLIGLEQVAQPLNHLAEYLVARQMAMSVLDRLEDLTSW